MLRERSFMVWLLDLGVWCVFVFTVPWTCVAIIGSSMSENEMIVVIVFAQVGIFGMFAAYLDWFRKRFVRKLD